MIKMTRKTNSQFLKEVYDKVKDEYNFKNEYKNAKTKLEVIHNECGFTFTVSPDNFLNNNTRCPKCAKNFKNNDIFKNEVKNLTDNEYSILGEYKTKRHKITFIHNACGLEFKQHPESFLKGHRCPQCGLEKRSSDNHYKYNSNLTEEDRQKRDMFSGESKKWRANIFKRDKYTCTICSSRGGKLNAHHLNSWNKFKEERFLESNGITLCDSCHRDFHKKYGYGDNTKEQFEDYKNTLK